MENQIKYIKDQKEIIKKYVQLIDEECENYIISYLIEENANVELKDEHKYKKIFDELDKSCKSEVFKKLYSFFEQVRKTCSFLAKVSRDGGTTTFEYDRVTKEILGCTSIDLPPYDRGSIGFVYLHEAVHGLFWDSRKGKEFINTPNIEVLPYFFMLYALEHLYNNYSQETINSILGRFIANSYSCGKNVLYGLDNKFVCYSEEELKQKFYHLERYELEDIEMQKKEIYSDYQQFLGPIKSIILYNYCKKKNIPFEVVLDSVMDADKKIGTEVDYNLLDISKEENFVTYEKFVKTKKLVLPAKTK